MRTPKSDELRVIDRAVKILKECGWTKETYATDREGKTVQLLQAAKARHEHCFCAEGALLLAQRDLGLGFPNVHLLRGKLEAGVVSHLPDGYSTLPDFNDDKKTKLEDVLGFFERLRRTLKETGA